MSSGTLEACRSGSWPGGRAPPQRPCATTRPSACWPPSHGHRRATASTGRTPSTGWPSSDRRRPLVSPSARFGGSPASGTGVRLPAGTCWPSFGTDPQRSPAASPSFSSCGETSSASLSRGSGSTPATACPRACATSSVRTGRELPPPVLQRKAAIPEITPCPSCSGEGRDWAYGTPTTQPARSFAPGPCARPLAARRPGRGVRRRGGRRDCLWTRVGAARRGIRDRVTGGGGGRRSPGVLLADTVGLALRLPHPPPNAAVLHGRMVRDVRPRSPGPGSSPGIGGQRRSPPGRRCRPLGHMGLAAVLRRGAGRTGPRLRQGRRQGRRRLRRQRAGHHRRAGRLGEGGLPYHRRSRRRRPAGGPGQSGRVTLLSFAFGAGILATVNPCGFAMLPAFLAFYLGEADGLRSDLASRFLNGLGVGAAVSAGFAAVFVATALATSAGLRLLVQYVPWVAVVIGAALVVVGGAMLAGRHLGVGLVERFRPGTQRTVGRMVVFGAAYAVASLSCTLAVLLALVAQAL